MRVLLIFVDGVGLGEPDPDFNPFAVAELPTFAALLGADWLRCMTPLVRADASLAALDAQLGVAGLPQSGTGQSALLTGENTARRFGRHAGPWVPTALRSLVRERSVLARARAQGAAVAFANAYPEELVAAAAPRGPLL
ncbi:MAG: hypothetical protein ACRELD_08935, partial [Longimicrobiales bacterium]